MHKAHDLCLHPIKLPSNSRKPRQTLPAPPVSGLQQPYQRFLPPPELPAASNLLQISIPTRPPDLHTYTPSRPPYLASIPTQPPYLQVFRPLRLHACTTSATYITSTTSTNPRHPRCPDLHAGGQGGGRWRAGGECRAGGRGGRQAGA